MTRIYRENSIPYNISSVPFVFHMCQSHLILEVFFTLRVIYRRFLSLLLCCSDQQIMFVLIPISTPSVKCGHVLPLFCVDTAFLDPHLILKLRQWSLIIEWQLNWMARIISCSLHTIRISQKDKISGEMSKVMLVNLLMDRPPPSGSSTMRR